MNRNTNNNAWSLLDETTSGLLEEVSRKLKKEYPDLETAVFGGKYEGTNVRVVTKIICLGMTDEDQYKYKIINCYYKDELLEEISVGNPKYLNLPKNLTDDNYEEFMVYYHDYNGEFYIQHLENVINKGVL